MAPDSMTRRGLLGRVAAITAAAVPAIAAADVAPARAALDATPAAPRRTLIRGGHVVSVDPAIGEIPDGDVLIEGSRIVAVGKHLAAGDAFVVDARHKVVLPGFIDTHRHAWETLLRGMIAEGNFDVYERVITGAIGPSYRPGDVMLGNELAAVSALNSGVTTMLDWSHCLNTPEHADGAIAGLKASGIRAVFAHGDPQREVAKKLIASGSWADYHQSDDIKRIQRQYFQSNDQLITLALALRGPETQSMDSCMHDMALARELGIRMTMHVGVLGLAKARAVTKLNEAKLLGPDLTHVHATRCTDEELQMIRDSGGTISSAAYTEYISAHGLPNLQRFLRFGLKPSLSVDNETRMPPDLFAPMRSLIAADHTLESARAEREGGQPTLVPMRDVVEYATLQGAKATGLDAKVGSLAPGKRADIILVDIDGVNMYPVYDPVASVVLLAQAADVSWVFVDGHVRKKNGKMVGIDLAQLRTRAVTAQQRLLSDAKIPYDHPM